MGAAPKKKVEAETIQLWGAVISLIISTIISILLLRPELSAKAYILSFSAYFISGFLNCIGMTLMSNAMQKGPNGIVWTITQSAMILPFIVGILFFNVQGTAIRFAGMASILTALMLLGLGKTERSSKCGNWKLPAFASWLVIGVQQNMFVLPSYIEACRSVPVSDRAFFSCLGAILSALLLKMIFRKNRTSLREDLRNKYFWIFVLGLQTVSILVTYLLQFPGTDAMAENGLGNTAYPIMVSSCLVGFFFYSLLFLGEKIKIAQFIALLCCFAGVIMICM